MRELVAAAESLLAFCCRLEELPFEAKPLELSGEQTDELRQMSVSGSLPAGDVIRARMILMLADGRSYAEIQDRLQTTVPTISCWKKRFLNKRLNGLIQMRHPGQQPTVITPKLQARVREATRRKPKDGSTYWSVRKLARELKISKDTVYRIWRTAGIKNPHRLERYMARDDPDFEAKAADIMGLYLNPPQHAAVFCVDEKIRHSGAGPTGSGSAPGAGQNRAARIRVLSTRDVIPLHCAGCEVQ
jgi:transposase